MCCEFIRSPILMLCSTVRRRQRLTSSTGRPPLAPPCLLTHLVYGLSVSAKIKCSNLLLFNKFVSLFSLRPSLIGSPRLFLLCLALLCSALTLLFFALCLKFGH